MNDARGETIRFPVAGMTCVACVGHIRHSVRAIEGVRRVRVDLRRETATVSREPALVSNAALAAAVERAGGRADMDAAVAVPEDESRSWWERLLRH